MPYEQDFLDVSYGFREGLNGHGALKTLELSIMKGGVTTRAMPDVNGLAARHCECRGGCDLEAKRVWEPPDERMTAAPKYGSLLKSY